MRLKAWFDLPNVARMERSEIWGRTESRIPLRSMRATITGRVGDLMPTVLRWGPYRAFFYSNESGEPAHVHVRAGDNEAKFWLQDMNVAVNAGFPAHEIGDIVRYLKTHREALLSAWQDHFGN